MRLVYQKGETFFSFDGWDAADASNISSVEMAFKLAFD
jgi:hypothetical protein